MSDLKRAFENLPTSPRMPTLFIGHGNPMNAIEDNAYARSWKALGEELPTPTAILCVSAHWMTRGSTLVHIGPRPKTIHDFGGFPAELFAQQYPAPGAPDVAQAAIEIVRSTHLHPDTYTGSGQLEMANAAGLINGSRLELILHPAEGGMRPVLDLYPVW
jgi:4,5-DOPA dioxygenase extradiol